VADPSGTSPRKRTEREEALVFAALVVAGFLIAVSCAAVVGAVTYAGWLEPGSGLHHDCQTAP
jgi:hypothetical protein